MQTAIERRRSRFLKALAADGGKSQAAWAREQALSRAHLSLFLAGKRESLTLARRVDAYIAERIGRRNKALAS